MQIDQPKTGAERRRYPRLPMAMNAVIHGGMLEGLACVIRDYCPGGLFLSWPDSSIHGSDILANSEKITGNKFTIGFAGQNDKSNTKSFSITFKVVRVFQGGMGVIFVEPDRDALNYLSNFAKVSGEALQNKAETSKIAALKHESASDAGTSENERDELINNIDTILFTYFKKMDNRLHILLKDTREEQDKFEFFNASELLHTSIEQYKTEVKNAVVGQLETRPIMPWEKAFDESVDGNSLTLVDEKEFEAYLILTGIISDAEADNRLLLYRVTKKISSLFNVDFDQGLNPIGFSRLCRTIDDYLQYKQFGYKALKVAYDEMDSVLIPELIVFYEHFARGIEAIPERKKNAGFDRDLSVASARLEDKVEYNNKAAASFRANSEGVSLTTDQFGQPFANGNHTDFPSLENYSSPSTSPVPEGAGDLAQTLMALKQSMAVPGALNTILKGRGNPGYPIQSFSSHSVQQNSPFSASKRGGMHAASAGENLHATMDSGKPSENHANYLQSADLLQFLNKIQEEDNRSWQNGETIYDLPTRLGTMLYGANQDLDTNVQGALDLAGNVLNFLGSDQQLSQQARQDLKRLQSVIYKQAISDGGLLQQRSNPFRNIVNLLEQLDKKGGNSQQGSRQIIDNLIGKILSLESYDDEYLSGISEELNSLLEKQEDIYKKQLQEVAEQCDLEQTIVAGFKKSTDQEQTITPAQQQLQANGEWRIWQNRAKELMSGDTVMVDDENGEKKRLTLAWTGPNSSSFVFVDGQGKKAASMTQQELIVRLLKGTAEIAEYDQQPVFDKAIVTSLFNAYEEVKQQIEHDQDTGVLNEEKYHAELNQILENARRDHAEHALFYIETYNETESDEGQRLYLKHLVGLINETFGEQSIIGRLSHNTLAVTSEFISREGALILAETLLKAIEDKPCQLNDDNINHPLAMGITIISDESNSPEELINQVKEAVIKSKEQGENQAWLYEANTGNQSSKQPAIDWEFWLEDCSEENADIPLFGQKYRLQNDTNGKPIMHLFPAFEDEEGAISMPDRFIRSSKNDDLVINFEKQFIKFCLVWMTENKKKITSIARCLISLSDKTVNSKGFLDFIIDLLTKSTIPPGKICFEISGNILKQENKNVVRLLRTLKELGCRFSVGQSGSKSISQEAFKFPISYICIDRLLLSDADSNAQSFGLIKSINDIAHMMDKQTIVPTLVTDQLLEILSELNIDYISATSDNVTQRFNPAMNED